MHQEAEQFGFFSMFLLYNIYILIRKNASFSNEFSFAHDDATTMVMNVVSSRSIDGSLFDA